MPARGEQLWRPLPERLCGGFPYSEGIFEDINKVLSLQWYWDPTRTADAILTEYAAAHFGMEATDGKRFASLCRRLEANLPLQLTFEVDGRPWRPGGGEESVAPPAALRLRYPIGRGHAVEATRELARDCEERLSSAARSSWRWRLARLRAEVDAELAAGAGTPTPALAAALEELQRLYHAGQSRVAWVVPPVPQRMVELLTGRPSRA